MNDTDAAARVLQFDRTCFRFPRAAVDVLRIESLTLRAGERLLVQGASGSGKSTLLSLAAGVLLPVAGEVRLLGREWRALAPGARDRHRADHIGYIFQRFNLLPYLSVLDNVLLACQSSGRRANRCEAARSQQHSDCCSLWASRRPCGSARPRCSRWGSSSAVAAARALIGRPDLVIADEPTSTFDEAPRDSFMALLLHECDRAGSSLLFVSHDARLAAHFARLLPLAAANGAKVAFPNSIGTVA